MEAFEMKISVVPSPDGVGHQVRFGPRNLGILELAFVTEFLMNIVARSSDAGYEKSMELLVANSMAGRFRKKPASDTDSDEIDYSNDDDSDDGSDDSDDNLI